LIQPDGKQLEKNFMHSYHLIVLSVKKL